MEARAWRVVSLQYFSKRNMLRFLGGLVAAQRLAAAVGHERIYLFACTSGKHPHGHQSLPFQAHIIDLDFKIFDSERLTSEVEKRPSMYS